MKPKPIFKFRLYVAAGTSNSIQALANLTAMCRTHIPGRYEIETVNVLNEPKRALDDGIFMTPTLVKLAPAPVQHIVGNLVQSQIVMHALEMEWIE